MLTLTVPELRRSWMISHGLDRGRTLAVPELASRFGWPRTLGGADAYVALAARDPTLRPADVDAALAAGQALQVIPAARSCIYVVPRTDAPAALRFGSEAWKRRTLADCLRAGVLPAELIAAVEATAERLTATPQTTDALRQSLPPGVIRPLGDIGKKVGKSTVFPDALRFLELDGRAERAPESGHLLSERYVWRRPEVNRLAALAAPEATAALQTALARHYFAVAAPGRVRDFADWAGLGQKEAALAMAPLDLARLAVDGQKEPYFVPADRVTTLTAPPPCESPRLLSMVDPLTDYRSALPLLVEPRFHDIALPGIGGKLRPIRELGALWLRVISDDGAIVGVWDFDPDAGAVVAAPFAPLAPARKELLALECERTTRLLRDTLGDARAYAIDSEKSLRDRAAFVRGLGK